MWRSTDRADGAGIYQSDRVTAWQRWMEALEHEDKTQHRGGEKQNSELDTRFTCCGGTGIHPWRTTHVGLIH